MNQFYKIELDLKVNFSTWYQRSYRVSKGLFVSPNRSSISLYSLTRDKSRHKECVRDLPSTKNKNIHGILLNVKLIL